MVSLFFCSTSLSSSEVVALILSTRERVERFDGSASATDPFRKLVTLGERDSGRVCRGTDGARWLALGLSFAIGLTMLDCLLSRRDAELSW